MPGRHPTRVAWASALVFGALVALSAAASAEGESLRLPLELHENLDPIAAIETQEDFDSSAEDAAMHAAAEAARHMDETERHRAPADTAPQEAQPEAFSGENPHEAQMDDLFGDMRKQQEEEEEKERMRSSDRARFAMQPPENDPDNRLGGDSELGESHGHDKLGEGVGATTTAAAAAATTAGQPLLASPDTQIQPGVDELQSYSTGFVSEEVQVGSQNGILADAQHGFTAKGSAIPKGRVVLFGKQSGLYLDADADDTAWSIYSDADKESGGVCLMTAYNNDVKGLKACHTDQATGMWASGNVGVTGNLMLEGKDSVIDVQRLHLHQTNVNHNGYVLKIGSKGPALAAGVSDKSAWMQVTEKKVLLLNPSKGNVGFGTETPVDKMHVGGTMAANNIYVGHTEPIMTSNRFTLKSGTGWEMTDEDWLRVINNKGIEAQAGAYFTDKVGVNFNWKTMPSEAKLRVNDGRIHVTRKFGTASKGVAMFYDDTLGEGRVYARDFEKKVWAPMRWEADALIFNPDGKSPIAIGTRNPKDKYLLHIEGNNKIDGHIYVAKKMKVGGKAHVANLHTPRLNVKDQRGLDGSGQEPADGVMEFVIGEWEMKGETYEMKPGGTNLRLGYWKAYCWMQMWPTGKSGSPLVLNGAGNRVGFGTTRPLTNLPGSGSTLLFHVDGNMLVQGNLVVKGQVSSGSMMEETETLLDIGSEDSAQMLHHLNAQKPKEQAAAHFADSKMHQGSISVSHIAATLMGSLQQHQAMLEADDTTLSDHESRLAQLTKAFSN